MSVACCVKIIRLSGINHAGRPPSSEAPANLPSPRRLPCQLAPNRNFKRVMDILAEVKQKAKDEAKASVKPAQVYKSATVAVLPPPKPPVSGGVGRGLFWRQAQDCGRGRLLSDVVLVGVGMAMAMATGLWVCV